MNEKRLKGVIIMRNKKLITGLFAGAMVSMISFSAFAGSWQSDANGWWWQNDDGSYPISSWKWIDGNHDNISERYYFDGRGYMLANTAAPDGSILNADGAWTVNGTVQTTQIINIEDEGYTDKISNLVYDLMNSTKSENRRKYGIPDRGANGYIYPSCPYIEVQYGIPEGGLDNMGYDTENDFPWILSIKSSAISFNRVFTDAPNIDDTTTLDGIKEHFESLGYSVIDAHSTIDSSDKRAALELSRFDIAFDASSDGVLSAWVGDSGDFYMYIRQEMTHEALSAWNDIFNMPTAASGQ